MVETLIFYGSPFAFFSTGSGGLFGFHSGISGGFASLGPDNSIKPDEIVTDTDTEIQKDNLEIILGHLKGAIRNDPNLPNA